MKPLRTLGVLSILPVLIAACGGPSTTSSTHPNTRSEEAASASAERPTPSVEASGDSQLRARTLPWNSTFADLVQRVRRATDLRQDTATAPCIARAGHSGLEGFELAAELALGVTPLPDPWASMGDFASETETETLTVWGSQGNRSARLRFAAFTWTPPMRDREATVLWIHPNDMSLISSRVISGNNPAAGGVNEASVVSAVRSFAADRLVFVTADAGVTLRRLHDVLMLLAETRATVALAVPLPPGATLSARESATDLCPNGLPDPGTTAPPPSNPSDPNAYIAILRGMQSDLRACMQSVRGLGIGNVVMSLRIGAGGEIAQACVKEDQTTNAEFRSCLLSASRRLQFPQDWAHNDLSLPLRFRAEESQMIPLASVCQ